MRAAITVVVALLLVAAMSTAFAQSYVSVWEDSSAGMASTSSWFGNVGMVVTPTAMTPPASGVTATYHRIERDAEDVNVWGVNFGITDALEAGASRIDIAGNGTETVGNLKLKLDAASWLGQPEFPELAVGVFDLSDQIDRAYYLVLSKSFELTGSSSKINLHLGFADNETDSGSLDGLFGGLEFQALKLGVVQAEYDGDAFNAALRYNASRTLQLDLGVLDGDFGYGATYRSQF